MDSYDVKLIEQPTGAVHNVTGAGIQPILDETTGEPETQFVLVAIINDHAVPLQTFTKGYIEHQVGRPDTAIDQSQSASSSATQPAQPAQPATTEQPASPPEGAGTAGESAAAQPAPPAAG